jgi:plasmid rolling circle replication initiator protein Rep
MSQILGRAFIDLGFKKGERVSQCSCWMMFKQCPEDRGHPKRLKSANFCGVRLCPSCQKRRSFIEYRTTLKITHALQVDHQTIKYLFLTLTVPNVKLEKLGDELMHITQSWGKLVKRREVKRVIQGSHRAIEITYNHKTDTYHPHAHIILAVNSNYFTKNYIKHERWQEMWAESTGYTEDVIGSKLQVNIKRLNGEKGVSEACKYSLKPWNTSDKEVTESLKNITKTKGDITYGVKGHIYIRDTPEETTVVVSKLNDALHGKKLTHYAGLFKEYKNKMKLKGGDEESDLTHGADEESSCSCPVCNAKYVEQLYHWIELNKNYYACYG